ncbi:DNA replication factor Cdt1 isoform X2 [Fopius arisanus]|uniref:DNA replication factor Cdt1 isoform X2 n=1 Tax=Fopius arisanus TaxID=64838 RepID=A0A9R1UB23_9HYME|nr:PREDICTED: DNA replication factor Cdt1 isoform X2 [Fopius arisanus]
MSQPTVTSFFHTRKRQATDELRNKAKVLILEQRTRPKSIEERVNSVVRNIQFDAKTRTPRMATRARATRSRKPSVAEGQQDIRDSFSKINEDKTSKNVIFEKKGLLSPRKATSKEEGTEEPAAGSTTPKRSILERVGRSELSLREIKDRINRSSRLAELKASIDRIKKCEEKLEGLQRKEKGEESQENDGMPPKIRKFEKIELEVPVSPQKGIRSPLKTPTKSMRFCPGISPQRRLLFEPKEKTPSPVKSSPTKAPAYQRYQSIVDSATPALTLPFTYRFLGEVFRCVDTVAAMLFNRKETITFRKLKPAVQELLRRNFTVEHLAQVQTVLPEAFALSMEKMRSFGSASKQEKYELVIVPKVEGKSGRNTPDGDDVIKSAAESSMAPGILLERRRLFYNALLERVKTEHEKFLLNLESPMVIPREKITRWHPEFDVDSCPVIEKAELPQPPNVEKATSAHDVLAKAKSLFNCNTRMEKALQRLAEANMTSTSSSSSTAVETKTNGSRSVEISGVDTPPATPQAEKKGPINPALKGIPMSLLEKVRAKQAAKALEAMTRTPSEDKEAALHARLPEMSKILRNIFVAEKKGVLTLEFVIHKLDNSYRTKMTPAELEEHIKLMCKLLPTWASIHNVRKTNYLKIAKDIDIAKVVKRFEIMANDKVKG